MAIPAGAWKALVATDCNTKSGKRVFNEHELDICQCLANCPDPGFPRVVRPMLLIERLHSGPEFSATSAAQPEPAPCLQAPSTRRPTPFTYRRSKGGRVSRVLAWRWRLLDHAGSRMALHGTPVHSRRRHPTSTATPACLRWAAPTVRTAVVTVGAECIAVIGETTHYLLHGASVAANNFFRE